MNLKERWLPFVEAPHVEWTWKMIETLYSEPHRVYHNLGHIEACFKLLDQLRQSGDARIAPSPYAAQAVELAIFFHDIVYVPGDKRNEALSADLLRSLTHISNTNQEDRAAVAILATKSHETIADDAVARLVIDLDLSILGSSDGEYMRFLAGVRREYAHVSDDAWRLGRSDFLTKMLQRKVIFQNPWAIKAFEDNARENMKLELAELIRS